MHKTKHGEHDLHAKYKEDKLKMDSHVKMQIT